MYVVRFVMCYLFVCCTGTVLHGMQLRPEYARVQVETFNPAFGNCPLPNVQEGDEMQTISSAVGSFVQWPKKNIVLTAPPSGTDILVLLIQAFMVLNLVVLANLD